MEALSAFDDHLAAVRRAGPAPSRSPQPTPPDSSAGDGLGPGSKLVGTLTARNPGWILKRPDGVPLQVTVPGHRPARFAGKQTAWILLSKNNGVWTIRPDPAVTVSP